MKNLKNYINKVVNQHSEDVDNDALWAAIEQKMETPKKKRRFPLFLILGLSLSFILITFSGLYLSSKKQNPIAKNIPLKVVENQKEASSNIDTQAEIKLSKSEASSKTPKNNIASTSILNITTAINDDLNIVRNELSENTTFFKTSKNLKKNQLSIFSTLENKNKEIQNDSPNSNLLDKSKQDIGSLIIDKKSILEKTHTSTQKQKSRINIERIQLDFKTITSSSNLPLKKPKIDIQSINNFSIPNLSRKDEKQIAFLKSMIIYTEYGFGNKTIQGSNEYSNLRNESEEFLESIRFGFESDLVRFLDFMLYGGFSYASINDRLQWTETFYEDREITYLESVRILPNGTKIENYTTNDLPHLINDEALRYNSHRLISIPLGLRFGKSFSKIQLGVGFGIDLNYALSNTHTILNTDFELAVSPVGGKWLKPSFHSGFSVDYSLSERWFLHSKITYRNIKFENTSVGTASKDNYTIYGINLGVMFQF